MSREPFRLNFGGRIDRSRRVKFSFDGKSMSGFEGDSLAAALLAHGTKLIGRSFKYHRPRGFICAGTEEPNGLFSLGEGGREEPNVAGTTTELVDGLIARTQNGWPSVKLDLMAVNSWISPLLAAGFYYKTFMGPTRGSWMFYERFIRKAAGLGRGTYERDPDRYESRHAFADVLVVGAGPAGLQSALTAGRSGARVLLVEQDWLLGGSLLSEPDSSDAESWRQRTEQELRGLANVEILTRTTAFGVYDSNTVALVKRRDALCPDPAEGEPREVILTARARSIVFATGATERPLVFGNNDRPGVMLASAARTYLNRFGVLCGRQAAVITNNNSAYDTAFDLAKAGAAVVVADVRTIIDPKIVTVAKSLSIGIIRGVTSADVIGARAVKGLVLTGGHQRECDLVCVSGGWTPAVHLTSHGGIKPRYREDLHAFVPGGYAAHQTGVGGLTGSWLQELQTAPVWQLSHARRSKAFVDFQNDVTEQDLHIAHDEGYTSVEHLKRYTTLGMGTDQGKTSNVNGVSIMAHLRGIEIAAAATTTFRPPFTPVTIGALAGRHVGKHFRPIRRSPLHDWHTAHGAEMIEAGLWMRAWWYRWAGSDIERAYVEEMRHVRRAVGLSDVSTLGKIDVQGPDAAELLNRIYVNGFAKLPVRKARYGVMLTDDGAVLDDGTTTRFSETSYFMTTTTAQAADVMSRLEFLLQTAWTDLRVHVTSVTDEWAGMAVAGPRARAALARAFPGHDVSNAALPYMGAAEFLAYNIPVRLIRLSFSGELAYEVYVPADYGIAFWEHLMQSAEPLDIKPYGLEALASLRIEKGHVAGLELDHRNTLDDLGLGKMASRDKDFVGRELRQRPLLQGPERWSLVGLECLERGKRLRGGAILFSATDAIKGHGRGYITSTTWSTELGKSIALGLYAGGLKHTGEEIVCAFPLKGEQVRARIVSPVFIDASGERLRV